MISFQVSGDRIVAQLVVVTDAKEHPRIVVVRWESRIVVQSGIHTQLVPELVVMPIFTWHVLPLLRICNIALEVP